MSAFTSMYVFIYIHVNFRCPKKLDCFSFARFWHFFQTRINTGWRGFIHEGPSGLKLYSISMIHAVQARIPGNTTKRKTQLKYSHLPCPCTWKCHPLRVLECPCVLGAKKKIPITCELDIRYITIWCHMSHTLAHMYSHHVYCLSRLLRSICLFTCMTRGKYVCWPAMLPGLCLQSSWVMITQM